MLPIKIRTLALGDRSIAGKGSTVFWLVSRIFLLAAGGVVTLVRYG